MTRSHASKFTPFAFTAISLVLTSAIAQAQPEAEPLPPLAPPPAAEPALPPPAVQPTPWVDAPTPAAAPSRKPMPRPSTRAATPAAAPLDLERMPWRQRAAAEEPETPAPPPSKTFLQLGGGVRSSLVPDHGFAAFSDNKAFTQVGLAASYTVAALGDLSFAPGLAWDYGGSSSNVRGDPSELKMHRFSVRLEGRYHVLPWMYAFARVAPGAMRVSLSVEDALSPAPLTQAHWVPSADLSAGAAFLVAPHGARSARSPRVWAEIDGGYGWAGKKQMSLTPDLASDDARRVGTLDLGDIALRGGFVRVALSLTF